MTKRKHRIRDELPERDHIRGYPREHYNVDHSPKMQYKTEQSAMGVARHMQKKEGDELIAYKCKYCGCWHLGHPQPLRKEDSERRARQVYDDFLVVLKGYKEDLEHIAREVLALQSKIEKLETTIFIQYHELKLKDNEKSI